MDVRVLSRQSIVTSARLHNTARAIFQGGISVYRLALGQIAGELDHGRVERGLAAQQDLLRSHRDIELVSGLPVASM